MTCSRRDNVNYFSFFDTAVTYFEMSSGVVDLLDGPVQLRGGRGDVPLHSSVGFPIASPWACGWRGWGEFGSLRAWRVSQRRRYRGGAKGTSCMCSSSARHSDRRTCRRLASRAAIDRSGRLIGVVPRGSIWCVTSTARPAGLHYTDDDDSRTALSGGHHPKLELIAPSGSPRRAAGSGIELPLPDRPRKATELRLRVVGNRNMAATIIPDKE